MGLEDAVEKVSIAKDISAKAAKKQAKWQAMADANATIKQAALDKVANETAMAKKDADKAEKADTAAEKKAKEEQKKDKQKEAADEKKEKDANEQVKKLEKTIDDKQAKE